MNAMQAELSEAVRQAWVALWQNCMREGGAQSLLTCDEATLRAALNGHAAPLLPPAVEAPSELVARLEGDGRISDITIRDVLAAVEDYFAIFRQLRRVHPEAYEYFSRVGAPVCTDKTTAWRKAIVSPQPITNPRELPAFIGLFFGRDRDTARDELLKDKPAFYDFSLYEKRRQNIAVVSPWKWTIYDHSAIQLKREIFTQEETRGKPWLRDPAWGFHYFIGINDGGLVQALPMQRDRRQVLKNGGVIHHREFSIPPGLLKMAGKRTAHEYAATMFAVARNYAAAALSGAQLSVRRGDEVCRLGIPLSQVKSFFRDRDRAGRRRQKLLHYVASYHYDRAGRTVTVGEHLRGARRFRWRDYDITISAPGIHHASPEALTVEPMMDDDILPVPKDAVMVATDVAATMQAEIESDRRVPFRRGAPVARYKTASLEASVP